MMSGGDRRRRRWMFAILPRSKPRLVGEGVVELVEKFDVAHKRRVDKPVGDVVGLGGRGGVVDEVIERRRRCFSRVRRVVRTRMVNVVALDVVCAVVAGVDSVGGRIAVGRD